MRPAMNRTPILAVALFAVSCSSGTTSQDGGARDLGLVTDGSIADAQLGDAESPDLGVDPLIDSPITDRFRALTDAIEAERVMLGAPGAAALVLEGGNVTF